MSEDKCEEIMENFLNKTVKNLPSVIDDDAFIEINSNIETAMDIPCFHK